MLWSELFHCSFVCKFKAFVQVERDLLFSLTFTVSNSFLSGLSYIQLHVFFHILGSALLSLMKKIK